MPGNERQTVRCAIYTRKSSEEGLEQAHNSLDAQRDACEAYVLSQQHEGWQLIETRYDDGGFSGGSMQRPALTALLADIKAGKVDVVVVYKIDRLTRALLDFAKIVEILDASKTSFVAVTQAFNTTSSMGRLTLNILLSFAQFEREITGERIRDKFASTRAKGMWVGSRPPLGYDRKDGGLVVNEAEAAVVRTVFEQYLKLKSIPAVARYAAENALNTKGRYGGPGEPISHGSVCNLLKNPIYIGKIRHHGEVLPGLHEPIVTPEDFEKVGKLLTDRRVALESRRRTPPPCLLEGLLRTPTGEVFMGVPGQGRLYRQQSYQLAPPNQSWCRKIRAGSLDSVVLEAVWDFLNALALATDPVRAEGIGRLTADLRTRKPLDLKARLANVVDHVILNDVAMTVTIRLRAVALGGALSDDTDVVVGIARRTLGSVSMVSADGGDGGPDLAMVKLIGRGMRWFNELLNDRDATIAAIARREGFSACYVGTVMELAFLAPDLKQEILEGRHPRGLTSGLLKSLCPLPPCWKKQRELILTATAGGPRMDWRTLRLLKGPMVRREVPWREKGGVWPPANEPAAQWRTRGHAGSPKGLRTAAGPTAST